MKSHGLATVIKATPEYILKCVTEIYANLKNYHHQNSIFVPLCMGRARTRRRKILTNKSYVCLLANNFIVWSPVYGQHIKNFIYTKSFVAWNEEKQTSTVAFTKLIRVKASESGLLIDREKKTEKSLPARN